MSHRDDDHGWAAAHAQGDRGAARVTKYGHLERNEAYAIRGMAGVEVVTIGRNFTSRAPYMDGRLPVTDVLVDTTQRDDPSRAIVSNDQVGLLPEHALICDLVVDP
jgi:hypothetical protein